MVLTYCRKGIVDYELEVPIPGYSDIAWKVPVCFDEEYGLGEEECDGHCFRLARRKLYALREISIYVPGTIVGG